MEKILNNEQLKVYWLACVAKGRKVRGEGWEFKNGIYTDGYKATRLVKGEDSCYKVICSISKSFLGLPIFNVASHKVSVDNGKITIVEEPENVVTGRNITSLKVTTASNAVLNVLKVKSNKRWSGVKFFGLDRKEVQDLLCSDSSESSTKNTSPDLTRNSVGKNETLTSNLNFDFQDTCTWLGVRCYGERVIGEFSRLYEKTHKGITFCLRNGFISTRGVRCENGENVLVTCTIIASGPTPQFITEANDINIQSENISIAVSRILTQIKAVSKKHWSGFEFFGLYRADILKVLEKVTVTVDEVPLKEIQNIRSRNAGPTSQLKCKKSIDKRNEKIDEVVDYASFGDLKSYVAYLLKRHPEIVEESIINDDNFKKSICKNVMKNPPQKDIPVRESASLLISRTDLTQRGYKNLKKVLSNEQVELASYDNVTKYLKNLDVGNLRRSYCNCPNDICLSVGGTVKESLELYLSNDFWYKKLKFLTQNEQLIFFKDLKDLNQSLYGHLRAHRKTLFLRLTGDNFRAAGKSPTEQISFSVLNNKDTLHSPYAQMISSLWRGSESRINIEIHTAEHYTEVKSLLVEGLEVNLNGKSENFNVIPILCADLSFVKEVLGKCSCTSMFGCMYCKKIISKWDEDTVKPASKQSIEEMSRFGEEALKVLGKDPKHETKQFTEFQQNHFGQYAPLLFDAADLMMIIPCGLHLILAHHRYMWKFMFDIVVDRKQEDLIPRALRQIDCGYLAFQIECYHKSKKKYYDGSSTLKMIGQDCKQFELNIEKFAYVFLKEGEEVNSKSFGKMRQIISLYRLFRDLAQDIRTTSVDMERIDSFEERVEVFFKTFKRYSLGKSTGRKPYLHILREHVPNIMRFWAKIGFAYGFFNCNAGEHLNKRIKTLEISGTNFDSNRFENVARIIGLKQFHYPESVFQSKEHNVICSVCHEVGHNKKNKNCRGHPSQPPHEEFDESDSESED